jgi:hypothetical protein
MLYTIRNLIFSRSWELIRKIRNIRHWTIRNVLETINSLNGPLYFKVPLSHSSNVNMMNTRAKFVSSLGYIYIYIYIYIECYPFG